MINCNSTYDDKSFHQVIAQLIEMHDAKNYMSDMLRMISVPNDWPFAELWLADDSNAFMQCKYTWTTDNNRYSVVKQFSAICKFAKGVGFIGKAWEKKQVVYSSDIRQDKDFLRADVAEQAGLLATICIPVHYKSETLAVLCILLHSVKQVDIVFAETLHKNRAILGSIINSRIV